MFPLLEKSLNSNLDGEHMSKLWRIIFKILRTLMNMDHNYVNQLF